MKRSVQLVVIGFALIVVLAGCAATQQAKPANGNGNALPAALAAPNVTGQWDGIWQRQGSQGLEGRWSMELQQVGSQVTGAYAPSGHTLGGSIEGEMSGRRLSFRITSRGARGELTVNEAGTVMSGFMLTATGRNWVRVERVTHQ